MAYKCPRCKSPVHRAGAIKVKGPYGRFRLVQVYICRVCGWRGIW